MTPVLLDTGCIVALLDAGQSSHHECKNAIEETPGRLVTCEAVLSEACFLLRRVKGAREAILANVQAGVFEIPFRLADHALSVKKLMTKYAQVPMSLADACLVVMAEELGTGDILTLDRDFRIYRWRGHRPFDILIP